MDTSTHFGVMAVENRRISKRKRDSIGMCLQFGHILTFCGKPFLAELPCTKCLYINAYNDSRQPVSGRY